VLELHDIYTAYLRSKNQKNDNMDFL